MQASETTAEASPLVDFVREYAEAIGGAWDEVEPQVFDLLLPAGELGPELSAAEGVVRLAFDPEAVGEHPGSQLASLGTPVVDRLLSAAMKRGQFGTAYYSGLSPAPFDLDRRLARALTLPDGARLVISRTRTLLAAQGVYWFEATFESDQKEQEVLAIGLDLRTGREVRHLDRLLVFSRLSEQPAEVRIEARRCSAAAAYALARQQVLRTLSALANVRRRELADRVERQGARMTLYYHDLAEELSQQQAKAQKRGDDTGKFQARIDALHREARLRTGELRQKHTLRVRLRLLGLLLIEQPKVICHAVCLAADGKGAPLEVELCWDPLMECVEAASCPHCQASTYELSLSSRREWICPACAPGRAAKGEREA